MRGAKGAWLGHPECPTSQLAMVEAVWGRTGGAEGRGWSHPHAQRRHVGEGRPDPNPQGPPLLAASTRPPP